jgi:Lrp/AsnC family transcriptional regulator, leucine-responsive regulatory protein
MRRLTDLDAYDRSILRALQADARLSVARLSERVHLSPSAASERLRRLRREGFITGFQVRIDPEKVGAAQAVFLLVTLDHSGPSVQQAFLRAVNALPQFQDGYMMAGEFDFLLKMRVADMAACQAIVSASIQALPGVRRVRAYSVISQFKESSELPL